MNEDLGMEHQVPPKGELDEEKVRELLTLVSQEVANFFEISDGGYNTFPDTEKEKMRTIRECLETVEVIIESESGLELKPNPEVHNLYDFEEYIGPLGVRLHKIDRGIQETGFRHQAKIKLLEQVNIALSAYESLA